MRPLLPSILINGFQTPYEMLQAGIFGLGPNSSLNQWTGRVDLSYQPLWQLEGMGIGNLARIKEQRGEESRAIIELFRTQDMVAADVTRAQARLQSAALRVVQADRAAAHGASSPSTATTRASSRPPASATSWSWSTARRRRSSPSSS